jgi:hypothetical protein
MPAPSTLPTWATSGPTTVPTSGKKAAGFTPQERGAAQYLNWLFNLLGQWITWLNAQNWTVQPRSLLGFGSIGSAWVDGSSDAGFVGPNIKSSGSGKALIDLEVPEGRTITAVSFDLIGDGAADLTTTVYTQPNDISANTSIGALTSTNPAASWAHISIDVTDTLIDSTKTAFIQFDSNAAGLRVKNLRVSHIGTP